MRQIKTLLFFENQHNTVYKEYVKKPFKNFKGLFIFKLKSNDPNAHPSPRSNWL